MWFYIKWSFRVLLILIVGGFLHYTLPRHDIGRITDAYSKRVDFGGNWLFYSHAGVGDAEGVLSRDVFFISAILRNGKPMEYRNEDTGWGWPPYFKFRTATVQNEAADLKSSSDAPKWVAIRHYGWRSNIYSIYPNAMKVWQVDGPDVRIIPWFNIVFFVVFAALLRAVWVRWRRFREARIDPVLEKWEGNFEAAEDNLVEQGGRLRRWFSSWRQ
jgi:hypothetical protein